MIARLYLNGFVNNPNGSAFKLDLMQQRQAGHDTIACLYEQYRMNEQRTYYRGKVNERMKMICNGKRGEGLPPEILVLQWFWQSCLLYCGGFADGLGWLLADCLCRRSLDLWPDAIGPGAV